MKKLVKIGAVLAALALFALCFVSCDNGETYEGGDPTGLWLSEKDTDDGTKMGYYIDLLAGEAWVATEFEGEYYYFDKTGDKDMVYTVVAADNLMTLLPPRATAGISYWYDVSGVKLKMETLLGGKKYAYTKVDTVPSASSEAGKTLAIDKVNELTGRINKYASLFGITIITGN